MRDHGPIRVEDWIVIFAGAFIMLVAVLTTGAVAYQERSSRAP